MSQFKAADFQGVFTEGNFGKFIGRISAIRSLQAVMATLAADPTGLITFDGQIGDVFAVFQNVLASGESVSVDVLKNGVTVLTAPVVINAALMGGKKYVPLFKFVDKAKLALREGDLITITRTYTAGGTPVGGASAIYLEPTLRSYDGIAY